MDRRALVAVGLGALLLTACGTTVPLASQRAANLSAGGTSGVATGPADTDSGLEPAAPVAGATAVSSAATQTGATASAVGDGPAGATTITTTTATKPGTTAGTGTVAAGSRKTTVAATKATPGATKGAVAPAGRASAAPTAGSPTAATTTKPFLIGYLTERDASETAGNLGISGADVPDVDAIVKAAVDNLNSHGGILGRQVTTLDYDINSAQAETNPSAVEQAACTAFTQDNHVDAVIDTVGATDSDANACLAKAGVAIISDLGADGQSAADFAGNLYSADGMSIDRYAPLIISHLKAAGFMTGWNTTTGQPSTTAKVKFGIEHFNTPGPTHYAMLMESSLAAAGYPIAASDDVSYNSDVADSAAATSAAVLQFASDGVTHVINANVLFYKDAQSQDYHPRYEVDDLIATPALLTQNAPASQLHGSMGVGFQPFDEVPGTPDPTSGAAACRAVMAAESIQASDNFQLLFELAACDGFNLLKTLATLGGGMSLQQFAAAAQTGKATITPSLTYASNLTGGHHDGGTEVRNFAYDDSCTCFAFTSNPSAT